MASESLPGAAGMSGTLQNLSQVKLRGQRLAMQKGLPHKAPDSSYGLAFQKPSQHSVLSIHLHPDPWETRHRSSTQGWHG